jgi:SAM-dependent methyltransferase
VHTVAADRIPEHDRGFDFVFSNSVLEHIDAIEPVIAEVARLLKPGGVFLFTVPSSGFHACLAGPLLPWVDRQSYLRAVDLRCAHRRYWDDSGWRNCLQRHGVEPVRVLPYFTTPEVQRWETLSRFTAGVLYAIARERMQPIDIQRALRLRRRGVRLPSWAAAALAAAISAGVRSDASGGFGCLLVEGRKRK